MSCLKPTEKTPCICLAWEARAQGAAGGPLLVELPASSLQSEAQSASSLPPAFLLKRQLPLILTDDQKQAISSHSTSPSSQQRLVKPSTQDIGLLVHTWFSASRLPPSTEATTHTKLFQAMKTTHSVYLLCSLFKKKKKRPGQMNLWKTGNHSIRELSIQNTTPPSKSERRKGGMLAAW